MFGGYLGCLIVHLQRLQLALLIDDHYTTIIQLDNLDVTSNKLLELFKLEVGTILWLNLRSNSVCFK